MNQRRTQNSTSPLNSAGQWELAQTSHILTEKGTWYCTETKKEFSSAYRFLEGGFGGQHCFHLIISARYTLRAGSTVSTTRYIV